MAIQVSGTTVIDDSRKLVNYRLTSSEISTNTDATAGQYYVATASLTLTLPATPTVGDIVGFQNSSGTITCVIERNGSNIMSLAQNLTIDSLNASVLLQYVSATRGWVFV